MRGFNYANEATANASRTRQKPPSARELAAATVYHGVALIRRGRSIGLWEPSGPYGARWLSPCHSEGEAKAVIDQMRGAE